MRLWSNKVVTCGNPGLWPVLRRMLAAPLHPLLEAQIISMSSGKLCPVLASAQLPGASGGLTHLRAPLDCRSL